jgi:hypothetical protein
MYTAKDGKNFGNAEMGRHYDRTRARSGGGQAPTGDHEEPDGDEASPESVVEEHGNATHTHIHGPEKTGDGSHHVHSFHPDGHHHVSKGHDAESAHHHSHHMLTGERMEGDEGGAGETEAGTAGETESPATAQIPGM